MAKRPRTRWAVFRHRQARYTRLSSIAVSPRLCSGRRRNGVARFSAEARNYVEGIEQRIILIDGRELARLMFEFGVGVTPIGS